MKTLILSAHCDDAIFSLGDYIQRFNDVTIMSVFSGIPNDPVGINKHTILRREHQEACEVLGVDWINLNFLDDVYMPRPSVSELIELLPKYFSYYDDILSPIGIHHPDHILLREAMEKLGVVNRWYKDLPYATLYPEIKRDLVDNHFKFKVIHPVSEAVAGLKQQAVKCYASQLQNDHILGEIMVTEEVYG